MITVNQGKEPEFMASELVELAQEKLEEFYHSNNRSQKRYSFPLNKEIDHELKEALRSAFYDKCGYCEIKIESPELATVDRYRPNTGVRDKNEYFQDLYWWLTFEWNNLVYCCKECNQYKANYFPIKGKRAMTENEPLEAEKPLLLSPYDKNVENHFSYRNGEISSESDPGIQTIELIRLNRTTLVKKRRHAISEIKYLVEKIMGGMDNASPIGLEYLNQIFEKDPKIEFLFAKHEYLLKELDLNPFLRGYILNDTEYKVEIDPKIVQKKINRSKSKIISSEYFPIEYIEIFNFKSIGYLKIHFPKDEPEQNAWIAILGENGIGKSSILQAFCLGIAPNIVSGDQKVSRFIKTGLSESQILIKERDSENILITRLIRDQNKIEHSGHFSSPLIGYGSIRLLPDPRLKAAKNNSKTKYQNLFDPLTPLDSILEWLSSIFRKNIELFDIIAFSLKELLPEEIEDNLTIIDNELVFQKSGIRYQDLSDGYKSTIALALDIMKTLSDGVTDINKLSGIVLIDELGNQLHPRWQMRVVNQLKKAFPRVCFIISTHHPLCLRGLRAGEVIVLNRNTKNEIRAVEDLPDPSIMRVDQILASEFFGLSSLIDPKIEATFNHYYKLLSKGENASTDEKREIEDLRDLLRNQKQLGSSLREELMYNAIDKLLAQRLSMDKPSFNRQLLKEEVVDRVREIWKKLNLSDDPNL